MSEQHTYHMATANDLAAIYQISRFSVLRAARTGLIPSVRIGRLLRFDVAKVHEALESKSAFVTGQGDAGNGGLVDLNEQHTGEEVTR